ncbi:unnamed protein product [Trifolium pratense]|uniref:Uncharacterized protein n=1 Tax=Trifolium pratense TaxID=57577 RepID=A0ACB0LPH8_TRIPR|nr:unnamed protein product [Trifolium pratense]
MFVYCHWSRLLISSIHQKKKMLQAETFLSLSKVFSRWKHFSETQTLSNFGLIPAAALPLSTAIFESLGNWSSSLFLVSLAL